MSVKHIIFDCDGTLVDTSTLKYSLFPGIKELLHALSLDSKLYVWTARDRKSTLRILKELGILSYFESISTIDDSLAKPHVSGLLELVPEVSKSSICIIGDSSNDIIGAKNFGVKSIGAVWSNQAYTLVMKEIGADFVTDNPGACLGWIAQNFP